MTDGLSKNLWTHGNSLKDVCDLLANMSLVPNAFHHFMVFYVMLYNV